MVEFIWQGCDDKAETDGFFFSLRFNISVLEVGSVHIQYRPFFIYTDCMIIYDNYRSFAIKNICDW